MSAARERLVGQLDRLVGPALDAAILEALRLGPRMTYVVANILRMDYRQPVATPAVRRVLMRLEKAGRVERCKTIYATQICWGIVKPNAQVHRKNRP